MLKIALINGSPKAKQSASKTILKDLEVLLKDCSISKLNANTPELKKIDEILKQDVIIFAFPLYVDGVPSQLLHCLYQLEQVLKERESHIVVYAIANCGFYEGHQNKYALQMIRNWCVKSKIHWGQGLGIGGGGMVSSLKNVPPGQGPKKNMGIAMKELADNIMERKSAEDILINPSFPRFLYKLGGDMGWRQAIKANGLRTKDLFTRK